MENLLLVALFGLCIYLIVQLVRERRSYVCLKEYFSQNRFDEKRLPEGLSADAYKLGRTITDNVQEIQIRSELDAYQRRFLEALLDEIKDGIVILDRNSEIRFINHAARLLFPSDQPYQTRTFIDVCRDHRIIDTIDLACELKSKSSDQIDYRVNGEDPKQVEELILQVEAEPLVFGKDSLPAGAWILLRDVTKQLETEQIRQDFVANASHELRTPLSIINGYLEAMAEEDVDLNAPIFRKAIQTMVKHGDRIARITEDMLTISKLESSSNLLKKEPFDLVSSAKDMIDHLAPLIEDSNAKIKIELHGEDAYYINGDRYYWDQIFFNLIENALKQNFNRKLKIVVDFYEDQGRVIVSVTDNGIGIPASDIPLVFKRFYRVQKHHSQTEIKGTGLGLSIVKRGVEAHGGSITIDSIPGIETAFTISVPSAGEVPVHDEAGPSGKA